MKTISEIGKKLVSETFFKQKLLVNLGGKLLDISYGSVNIQIPKTDNALQHHGFFHGGVISTVADVASGLSGYTLLNDPSHALITIEFKINFMRPANGSSIIGYGKVLKQSKSIIVSTAQIYSDDKLCAYLVSTLKKLTDNQYQ